MDRAVSRAFCLLEVLASASEPLRLTEIAELSGLQKSTAHRILATLVELGYARQEASGRYAATLRAWEFGARSAAQLPIKRIAAGFLHGLHRTIGETVSLTLLSGTDVLYLDKIIAPRPVRFRTRVGSRVPAVLTASGKAILSQRPDGPDLVRRSAEQQGLDIAAVEAELDEARRRGYALSGYSPGVSSIGVAVGAGGAAAEAGLSVSAPSERLDGESRDRVIEALLEAGARMSEALARP